MARARRQQGVGRHYESARRKNASLPDGMLARLVNQKYAIVGEHSAAKLCHWAGESLKGQGGCYKSKFYGISSHRCLQCTPVLQFCNHACVFCWRMMPERDKFLRNLSVLEPQLQSEDKYGDVKGFGWDDAGDVAEGLVKAQKTLVSGFGGNPEVKKALYIESLSPKHVALSLTGEPAMYPKMDKLLSEFHARGMTTFVVTNGTLPEAVAKWKVLPTQFYVSMVAPNEEVYKRYIRPSSPGLWKKYQKTLGMMPEIGKRTRTVLRMTLCRGVNDTDLEGYAKQIKLAQPHYIEVKSMVFVGGARSPGRGLALESMLKMEEIEAIAHKLAKMTDYRFTDTHAPSRVALLCRDERTEMERKIKWQ
ncbi:MAG: 4-demethylwyosine synthase TYW1 [Candidatus Micrarchaeota archaeon]|nr:4-demethylwyosine synthase TYW1 [Candidatus Micrarchaeota archaeon]